MWTKFQVKIRKHGFIDKLAPIYKNSLKIHYLGPDIPWATYIRKGYDITHDAHVWKRKLMKYFEISQSSLMLGDSWIYSLLKKTQFR
jgi:hypothetical protein